MLENVSAEEHSNKLGHQNTGAEAANDVDLSAYGPVPLQPRTGTRPPTSTVALNDLSSPHQGKDKCKQLIF